MPVPAHAADRLALFAPGAVFLNAAAQQRSAATRAAAAERAAAARGARGRHAWRAGGAPLAVMDIARGAGAVRPAAASCRASTCGCARAPTARRSCASAASCRRASPVAEPGDAAPAREQPVARLPRQPHRAGAGGAVHRRLPGVLGAGAQRGAARAAVRAARRAGPDARASAGGWCWPNRCCWAWSAARWARAGHRAGGARPCGCSAATWAAATSRASRRRCSGAARRRCVYGGARRRWPRWPAAGCRRAPRNACRWRRRSRAWAPAHAGARRRWPGLLLIAAGAAARAAAARGRHPAGRLPVGRLAAGRRHQRPALAPSRCCTTGWRRALADRLLPLLAVERARRVREHGGGGGQRRGRGAEPGGGADGDGGELPRFGDALARRGAAGRPVPAHARSRSGAGDTAFLTPRVRAGGARSCRACSGSAPQRTRALPLDPALPPVALLARAHRATPARSAAAGGRGAAGAAGPGRHLRERSHGRSVRRAAGHRFAPLSQHLAAARMRTAHAVFFVAGVWRDYVAPVRRRR